MSQLQVDSISSMGGGHVDGAGKVVQMLFYEWDSSFQTSSKSFTSVPDTSVSITPKFSNSRLIVDACVTCSFNRAGPYTGGAFRIVENGNPLQATGDAESYVRASGATQVVVNNIIPKRNECQTPVTAGIQKTFSLELVAHTTTNSPTATINNGAYVSTITVWEIAQ